MKDKNKPPPTPHQAVAQAACRARDVLAAWLPESECPDDAATRTARDHAIRIRVVRSVFLRFAVIQGFPVAVFPMRFPNDATMVAAFQAEIDAITEPLGHSELMSTTLEQLASRADQRGRSAYFTPRSMVSPIVHKGIKPLFHLFPPERTLDMRVCDMCVGGGVFLLELVSQLAERLLACGRCTDVFVARRLVAIHCAYGVDVDPVSVECTKLALWLECRAVGMPWSWLDGNIKTGDALVGLTAEQYRAFHWKPDPKASWPIDRRIAKDFDRAVELGRDARVAQMAALTAVAEGE